ncbi:hypothetical protein D3C72_1258790 [compost metagenome]
MIASASRSFTEPPGLKDSTLAYTVTPCGAKRCSLTMGVLPMVSRMESYRAMGALQEQAAPGSAGIREEGWLFRPAAAG